MNPPSSSPRVPQHTPGIVSVAILLASLTARAVAQEQRPAADWRFGFDGLRMMFESQGLETVTNPARWSGLPRSATVVVVLGDTKSVQSKLGDPAAYVLRGGAMLVATDRGGALLERLGVALERGPVVVPERSSYRGLADCPLISDFRADHPVFRNVQRIASNRPGYAVPVRGVRLFQMEPLAWLPDNARVGGQPIGRRALMMAAESDRGGRVLAAADHSLFINEMLLHADNAILAANVVDWLCDSGRRRYLVVLEDGTPLPAVAATSQLPAIPPDAMLDLPPESLVTFANSMLTGVEDANVFNRLLADQPRGITPLMFRQVLLLTTTGVVAVIALVWALRSRASPVAAAIVLAPASLGKRREQARVADGHLGGAAVALSRRFFRPDAETLDRDDDWVRERPVFELSGPVWQRWKHKRQLRALWRVACDAAARPMNAAELRRLADRIRTFDALRASGALTVRWAPRGARALLARRLPARRFGTAAPAAPREPHRREEEHP